VEGDATYWCGGGGGGGGGPRSGLAGALLELANLWSAKLKRWENGKQFDASKHKVLEQQCFSLSPAMAQCGFIYRS
jgi:hypothetical protein